MRGRGPRRARIVLPCANVNMNAPIVFYDFAEAYRARCRCELERRPAIGHGNVGSHAQRVQAAYRAADGFVVFYAAEAAVYF